MLTQWNQGSQVVWAVRSSRDGVSFIEHLMSRAFWAVCNKISTVQVPPQGVSFALLDRKVIDAVVDSSRGSVSLGALIAWTGFRSSIVPYKKRSRHSGRSHWTFRQKIKTFIDAMVGYSYLPMRVMSLSGIIIALLGASYAAFLIIRAILYHPATIQGWASLMVVVLILGGMQMVILGILGEYIWRSLEASRNRPLYFVEDSSD